MINNTSMSIFTYVQAYFTHFDCKSGSTNIKFVEFTKFVEIQQHVLASGKNNIVI